MTKEQSIINFLIAKLETIKTTNEFESGSDFETNLGNEIHDWDSFKEASSGVPIVIVKDISGSSERHNADEHLEMLTIEIEVQAEEGSNTADYLRKAKADIKRCLGKYESDFVSKFGWIEILPADFDKEVTVNEERSRGVLRMTFNIHYETKEWLIGEPNYT